MKLYNNRYEFLLFEGLNNDRRSVNDGLAYMTNIDQLDIGFEFPPYEDPPPPYSPPKPVDDIPTEAPPPYELTSSQVETEPIEIIHAETNAPEVGSDVGEAPDESPSAAAVVLLGNRRWTDNQSLRPLSALEPFQSELIELSQPVILDCKSALTSLSSPVLTGPKKRNEKDSRCQSHGFTNNRRSGGGGGRELFNSIRQQQQSTDSNIRAAASQTAVDQSASNNHSALKHLAFHQMMFQSSTPQLLLKMQNKLAHSSSLKATPSSSNIIRPDNLYRESPCGQHLFLQAASSSPSSNRSTRNLNGFDITMSDHLLLSHPLHVKSVESKESDDDDDDDDLDERRVKKHLSSSECHNNLMQRSVPEVSPLYFRSSQVLCADPRKEKKPVNLMKDKSKSFLCNTSLMKKQKYSSRPQLGGNAGPDSLRPNTKRSTFAQNLSCNASTTLKNKITEHPSSCLFVPLVPDDDGSSCICDSNADKTQQMYINESTTTLDDGKSLQPLAADDQSDFIVATRLEGLAVRVENLENTLMAGQNSQSSVGLPSTPQGFLLSPDYLPTYQQFLRSESMTSEASFYSICSETGEKKHTKGAPLKVSKGLTVQGTMSTGSGYQSPGDASRITDSKEHAARIEKMDLSSFGMEKTSMDNCIAKDCLRNTTSSTISTSPATSSLPVQGSHNYFMSDWKNEKISVSNSNNLQAALVNTLPFSSSKCLKELPHERMLERTKDKHYATNMAERKEKLSPMNTQLCFNMGEAELSYQSGKGTVKPGHDHDKVRTMFRDQLRQGVKDLVPGLKKHSSNRPKEHFNNGKKHTRSNKHVESFEYLVSRILQQLETTTSHFDDFAARPNAIRKKVQRPKRFGRKSDGYSTEIGPPRFSSKSVANQSRPMSLPNTKNTSFIDDAELTSLDFNNRNSCYMLEPVTGNDNDGCCQRLHYGEHEVEGQRDDCPSSGTPVSVAL